MPKPTPEQRGFARQLRHDLTDCEHLIWSHLRNRRLGGLKFRRQHPWPPYVLDFYCPERALVVELDGSQHLTPAGRAQDAQRTLHLHAAGLTVLRFSNLDVLDNLDGVLETIMNQAKPD
ncbi:endonuclease domain-containing protein [Stutzerimonas azotifigens]|uniref:endonuclease domain-containing protein n=1 Tax=Stutzerimonas azotifigens TaxID=291995 RepID=UPI0003FC39F2|nr:endonuclease domain-containing protein [Stutzerimonas azotifigens]